MNNIIKGRLRIVSPVHIGGAPEKHLQKGVDYLQENGIIYFLDEKKLIKQFGILNYSDSLANNKLEGLIKDTKNKLTQFAYKAANVFGEIGTDIKSNIKNSLSGKPIIPGSSFKGALRSVLYNYCGGGIQNIEKGLFGYDVSEQLFRFITAHDMEFSHSSFINTKTYNLLNLLAGGWKHGNRSTNYFNKDGFTFPHEIIPIDSVSDFEIKVNSDIFNWVKDKTENTKNGVRNIIKTTEKSKKIFERNFSFLDEIKKYTCNYLNAERAFFEKYKGQHSDIIIVEIDRLLELNEKAPLLRLGLGSGFHAMTGDTIHKSDHSIDYIVVKGNRTRGSFRYQDSAKSRKIAFEKSNQDLKFYLMGFVQLCSDEYYESIKDTLNVKSTILLTDHPNNEPFYEKYASDEKKIEPYTPMITKPELLKKPKVIDAIVVGQEGKMLLFKPFVEGFEETIGKIGYSSGMPAGSIISLMAVLQGKNQLAYQGSPIKRS